MLDIDGYPLDEALETIKNWDVIDPNFSLDEFMDFVRESWAYPDRVAKVDEGEYHLSTGGWSGNEDVIIALKKNTMFWMLYWESSRRGGHYVFRRM